MPAMMVQFYFPLKIVWFKKYFDDPSFLPSDWEPKSDFTTSETDLARMVADYISGMTDRYALNQYSQLFEVDNP